MEDPLLRVQARGVPETIEAICESPKHLLVDCLSRTRSVSAFEVWKTLARRQNRCSFSSISKSLDASSCATTTTGDECLSSFESVTSRLMIDRVMSRTDVSPLTSGRRSAAYSTPLSASDELKDDLVKLFRGKNALRPLITGSKTCLPTSPANSPVSGARTVGRWLKDRREKKKEEARVHNAQLHAAISVASVATAVAAITAATAATSSSMRRNNEEMMKMDMVVASAATVVAAQCVEAAEAMGADQEHLASIVSSAVNVRRHDDVTTLTAAAATALRGAATLKARTAKGEWKIATVAPEERGIDIGLSGRVVTGNSLSSSSGEIAAGHSFLGVCLQDFLANGTELLKRSQKGRLHRKMVSSYINTAGQVILKMKSRHVGGTLMKTDEIVVVDVISKGDHEQCHHFGLKTATRGVFEFECKDRREYEIWTRGIARLLKAAAERNHVYSCWTYSQPKQF